MEATEASERTPGVAAVAAADARLMGRLHRPTSRDRPAIDLTGRSHRGPERTPEYVVPKVADPVGEKATEPAHWPLPVALEKRPVPPVTA